MDICINQTRANCPIAFFGSLIIPPFSQKLLSAFKITLGFFKCTSAISNPCTGLSPHFFDVFDGNLHHVTCHLSLVYPYPPARFSPYRSFSRTSACLQDNYRQSPPLLF